MNPTPQPPPNGYRFLKPGEIIQEGDLCLPYGRLPWAPAGAVGECWTPDEYHPMCRKLCASDQTEFETIDEVWNALTEARKEIARLRNRLGEHDGCSRWGVRDAIALKPNAQPPEPTTACTCSESNEEHTCPFQEDVHNDSEALCRCCPVCTQRCQDDI